MNHFFPRAILPLFVPHSFSLLLLCPCATIFTRITTLRLSSAFLHSSMGTLLSQVFTYNECTPTNPPTPSSHNIPILDLFQLLTLLNIRNYHLLSQNLFTQFNISTKFDFKVKLFVVFSCFSRKNE